MAENATPQHMYSSRMRWLIGAIIVAAIVGVIVVLAVFAGGGGGY